ncbi:MAG TPA: hypothetical protein VME40_17890 [Caulobacteraceae bacterium]|nr:hypothetical protein [Caulobacteraceae bacterium]
MHTPWSESAVALVAAGAVVGIAVTAVVVVVVALSHARVRRQRDDERHVTRSEPIPAGDDRLGRRHGGVPGAREREKAPDRQRGL